MSSTGKIYGRIAGWGGYVPPQILTSRELEERLGRSAGWIEQLTGIKERRIAGPDETTATMATKAGLAALARADMKPTDVDFIIVATSTPDYLAPPISSQVQHALGADHIGAMMLLTGCSGFVYALSTAYQFIAAGSYRNILVIGSELISRFVDWNEESTCILFGDAAAAVVVVATDQPCGMKSFMLASDGSKGSAIRLPEGAAAKPIDATTFAEGRHFVKMDGWEVFKFATRVMGPSCEMALQKAGLTFDDIDWIVPHHANLRIITTGARKMNVPLDRFLINIERYANVSAASIPLALAENLDSGRAKPTETFLFVGFGAGLTWGAMVVQPQPKLHATT